jgi:hypothetical protein
MLLAKMTRHQHIEFDPTHNGAECDTRRPRRCLESITVTTSSPRDPANRSSDPMKLLVLHVAGCPNVAPLLERLAEITRVPVSTKEVASEADASATGMNGSPTLLIDGIDPFPPGQDHLGLACRLYRDAHGGVVRVPSIQQLRDAITAAGRPPIAGSRNDQSRYLPKRRT